MSRFDLVSARSREQFPGGQPGTVVQAVGLWISRALPRWVPILSLMIVVTFVLPGSGTLGLLVGIPVAVAGIAIGYYAWRRAGEARD